jgi:hypothetical protein
MTFEPRPGDLVLYGPANYKPHEPLPPRLYYQTQRPLSGWVFEDCSSWRIIQDIYRGRFMALGIVTGGLSEPERANGGAGE